MLIFSDADTPQALGQLAMMLEEGSRRFYSSMADAASNPSVKVLFDELVLAETHHQEKLLNFCRRLSAKDPTSPLPQSDYPDLMEGGIPLTEGLQWSKGKSATEILQFSMALETNACDLYLRMITRMKEDPESTALFEHLAGEEQLHLKRMAKLLEKKN